jgi:hypothetical protein
MKKALTIITITAGLAVTSQAQGLVNFNNSSAAGTKISINSVLGGAATGLAAVSPSAAAPTYYYALFSSTSATTVAGSGSAAVIPTAAGVGDYAFSDPNWTWDAYAQSGTTRGGQVTGSTSLAIPGIGGGSTGQFVILGWSSNIGSTVASLESFLAGTDAGVQTGFVGESSVTGALTLGNGAGITTPSPFGTTAPVTPGFVLGTVTVPEPTSIALGVMGGLSLLALRRKKA